MPKGKVTLLGAGPGDPGLMTCKGLRVLREADLVLFDALAPVELLNEVKPGCELIDVGKRSGHHSQKQKQITQLMIRAARAGKQVVRLKGGDPFIFGRGGEEAEGLARARLLFDVIPGVSSAIAVPAYAGIPLTHRDYNSTVLFLTGHGEKEGAPAVDWEQLASLETLVILMGVRRLAQSVRALLRAGKDSQTPAAVIQWGTIPAQQTVVGSLKTIARQAQKADIKPPAVIVIGPLVKLRRSLNWFETKPLFAKRILITRAREQASELAERFRAEGGIPIEVPTIEIQPPRSYRSLDRAIANLKTFDWLVLTSANGSRAFFERLHHNKRDARALAGIKIATVGPGTAQPLQDYGITPDFVAKTHRAEGLLTRLTQNRVEGKRILIVRAEKAREILPETLRKRGAIVTVVSCYRSTIPRASGSELRRLIDREPPDLLTFASSSMVRNFFTLLGKDRVRQQKVRKIPVACIGPVTCQTARKLGFKKILTPRQATMPALVATAVKVFQRRR